MSQDNLPENAHLTQRMFNSLLASQRAPLDDLVLHQKQTLQALLTHAAATTPFYREHLSGLTETTGRIGPDGFRSIESIDRARVERCWPGFISQDIPVSHGQQRIVMTAATAGAPLRVVRTAMTDIADAAAIFRHYDNFKTDCSLDMAEIMAPSGYTRRREGRHIDRDHWGHPWVPDCDRGRLHRYSVFSSCADQAAWLGTFEKPFYLRTYPSNLHRLLESAAQSDFADTNILAVHSTGEPVSPDLRETCRLKLGCEIIDHYATAECGLVATQCPESGDYHIQQESCLVEVLRDDGGQCDIGESGHLTLTPLYNYGFPLIRYQPGDKARLSSACSCGRTLPCLQADIHRPEHTLLAGTGVMTLLPGRITSTLDVLAPDARWRLLQVDDGHINFVYSYPRGARRVKESDIVRFLTSEFKHAIVVVCQEDPAVGCTSGGKFSLISSV